MKVIDKHCKIVRAEIREFQVIPGVDCARTSVEVKRNGLTTAKAEVYADTRIELIGFTNYIEAIPEMGEAIEYYLNLTNSEAVAGKENEEGREKCYDMMKKAFEKAQRFNQD